jgi:hypothetical protein
MVTYKLQGLAIGASMIAAGFCLAACNTDSLGSGNLGLSSQPAAATVPAKPPVNMTGRWRLVSATGQSCNMTFSTTPSSTAPAGSQGAVAPEGGCPGKFFTTRHWTFDHDALELLDHKNEPLVEMKRNAAGRFEGEAAGAGLVWLDH